MIEFQKGALRSYDYDAASGTLVLDHKNGSLVRYANVPQDVVDALAFSEPGTGAFVAQNIRGKFEVLEG